MKLTANFTLDELTKSQTAERKGINNNPSPKQIENLKALAVNILQPIRSHYNEALQISSGFRCAELCVAIGSKITSQHVADENAAAADFEIWGRDNKEVATYIRDNLEFDQLILEFYQQGKPSSGWVHCSYKTDGNNRGKIMTALRVNGKTEYKEGLIQ